MFKSIKHVYTRRFAAVSLMMSRLRFYITSLVDVAYRCRCGLQLNKLVLAANGKAEPGNLPAGQLILLATGDHGEPFRDIGGP